MFIGLSKYPVFSETGKEYKVDAYYDSSFGQFILTVYIEKKRIFGLFKWQYIAGGSFDGRYDASDWDYDIIKMAKHQVGEYEKGIRSKEEITIKLEKSVSDFLSWDGKSK